MSDHTRKLAEEIKAMSWPDRLRLAADLLEHRKTDFAYAIIDGVRVEIGACLALFGPGSMTESLRSGHGPAMSPADLVCERPAAGQPPEPTTPPGLRGRTSERRR